MALLHIIFPLLYLSNIEQENENFQEKVLYENINVYEGEVGVELALIDR